MFCVLDITRFLALFWKRENEDQIKWTARKYSVLLLASNVVLVYWNLILLLWVGKWFHCKSDLIAGSFLWKGFLSKPTWALTQPQEGGKYSDFSFRIMPTNLQYCRDSLQVLVAHRTNWKVIKKNCWLPITC